MPLDEITTRISNVVALNVHGVRTPGLGNSSKGGIELRDPISHRIVGIVWKDIEHPLPSNARNVDHGGCRVELICVDDVQTGPRVDK